MLRRTKISSWLNLSFIVVCVLLLVACGAESNGTEEAPNSDGQSSTETVRISIATAGTGGAFYPIGGAMANIINENANGVEARAAVTNGSAENVFLVNNNVHQFGFSNNDAIYWGYTGTGLYEEQGEQDILGLFNIYPSHFQAVVMADSGIESIADLEGKRVVVGPPGSTSKEMGLDVLEYSGLSEGDIDGQYVSFEEGATALRDGNVDALFVMSAYPNSQIMDLAATHDIKLLPIDDDVQAKLVEDVPFYEADAIEANAYEGQDKDVPTLLIRGGIFVNKDVSEKVAYEFTKAIFENLPNVHESHAAAKGITLEDAPNVPIPLHPGAKKFFEEQGLEVPED